MAALLPSRRYANPGARILKGTADDSPSASQRDANHPAQGREERATLGQCSNQWVNPKRVESIPHIALVKFNFVSLQKFTKFILKRNHSMMLLLSGNVIPHRIHF